jgi:hypothetical protein
MKEKEEKMKIIKDDDGKERVILSASDSPNFNKAENQKLCVKVGWPKSWKEEKEHIHIILQWFMYNRNYGCIKFRGKIINLNIDKDRAALLALFIEEGFCGYTERPRYPGARLIEVLDPEYSFIQPDQEHQFWVNALVFFLTELSDKEISEYNQLRSL